MIKNEKNYLVLSTVGDGSLHRYWKPSDNNSYDLALIYYGDGKGYPNDAKYHIKQKGPKYRLIYDFIWTHPEVLNYWYIWMPDDDIMLSAGEIDRLFSISRQHGLWISQPSIMGWYGLNVTLHHKDCFMRFTNYVEIMCPCFNQKALKECLHTFTENKSGWGIDHLWNQLLKNPKDKLAIIDDIVAFHTRPIGGGDTYKNQTGNMAGAELENFEVYDKYNLGFSSYNDLAQGKLVSTESFGIKYHNTVEYSRVYKQLEAGVDVSERLWPPSPEIKKICDHIREAGKPSSG